MPDESGFCKIQHCEPCIPNNTPCHPLHCRPYCNAVSSWVSHYMGQCNLQAGCRCCCCVGVVVSRIKKRQWQNKRVSGSCRKYLLYMQMRFQLWPSTIQCMEVFITSSYYFPIVVLLGPNAIRFHVSLTQKHLKNFLHILHLHTIQQQTRRRERQTRQRVRRTRRQQTAPAQYPASRIF